MNKKVVITIVVLIIAAVCGFLYIKNKKESSNVASSSTDNTEKNIVESADLLNNQSVKKDREDTAELNKGLADKTTENIATENKIDTEENKTNTTEQVTNKNIIENSNEKVKNQNAKWNTKYYIKVNYGANAVTIYEKDAEGQYTKPVKAMICSCGTETPKSGVYKTSKGYEWGYLVGGTFGRYSTRIKGGIMFHSVPYISESEDSLEYWEYDKLGTTASLGCVRLCVRDCKWIFDNCEVGTPVEFYSSDNPGPLGKPTMQKISDNEKCRNWDPTDPSPNSPWNKN